MSKSWYELAEEMCRLEAETAERARRYLAKEFPQARPYFTGEKRLVREDEQWLRT